MAQAVLVPCKGVNDIGAALNDIQPGDEVRYGANFGGHAVGMSQVEYEEIVKKTQVLEDQDRIMRFYKDGFYVARGVEPAAKRQVENWARSAPSKR